MKSSTVSSLSSIIYSTLLLSTYVVTVGLFEASCTVQVHATPQTPIDSAVIKRITFSSVSRQLWEMNRCSVASILNNSSPSSAYSFDIPSREHCEVYRLGSCQTTTGEGKPGETFVLNVFSFISVSAIQTSSLFSVSYYYKCQNLLNNANEISTREKFSFCDVCK